MFSSKAHQNKNNIKINQILIEPPYFKLFKVNFNSHLLALVYFRIALKHRPDSYVFDILKCVSIECLIIYSFSHLKLHVTYLKVNVTVLTILEALKCQEYSDGLIDYMRASFRSSLSSNDT